MKTNLFAELRKIIELLRRYVSLEYSYMKLTAAEKLTMLAGAVAMSAVILFLASMMLVLLLLASAEFFKAYIPPSLAYLASAGIVLVVIVLIVIFKRTLILNPISRFLTRLMLSQNKEKSHKQS